MPIELVVNGTLFVVNCSDLPADITLNTYIREHVGLTGTKFMCLEGGCGVCVCVISGKHPVNGKVQTWAVNSCLTLLNVCDGWKITTIEGLGNVLHGYHPIQKQMAKLNGSQCGYCTPGMVMNMYGLLKSKGGNITMSEVENSFGGNICRCTGYRPIMDAMKSFAIDSPAPIECQDIEDLGSPCPKTGQKCSGMCMRPSVTYENGSKWFWPRTLPDLFAIIKSLDVDKYMLVAGNTAHGIYRRSPEINHFVDINKIPDLRTHKVDTEHLTLGANLKLTETMEIFRNTAKMPGFEYCQELYNHFDLIANVPIRNMGTLAGNLMIKHSHPKFPSDIFITFQALGATVIIGDGCEVHIVTLTEFLNTNMKGKVILSFRLKSLPRYNSVFKSFKIMPRAQNAHAYVNAAFLLKLNSNNRMVVSAKLCFGGINPTFIHATATERLLIGKCLFFNSVIKDIFQCLDQELKPDLVLPDASVEYRKKLACGLFYKFILSIAPSSTLQFNLKSGGDLLRRRVSSGRQVFETMTTASPITQPINKLEGIIQCSGEAKYMNDIPLQSTQVWCAFVNATKVNSEIIKIDATAALSMPGVLAFYSAKDIPGRNSCVGKNFITLHEDEEIFCTGKVRYHNQPLGVIAAETSALANFAASKVKVRYSKGNPRIFPTMMEVLEANHVDKIKDVLVSPIEKLEFPSPADLIVSGSLELGQQYHFTMEPQTTVVIPTEGRLEVYSATQWMDMTQYAIAGSLRMKMSDVQLKVRRLGGGFGTKISRGNQAACAAALAAVKLNRPARFVQTIESMMGSLGKRYACYNEYEVHTNSKGRILGLQNSVYEDSGHLSNENAIQFLLEPAFRSIYDFRGNIKFDAKIVLTDAPSHTWCRAPASLEGHAMIENIMEHIAFELDADPVDVRLINISTDHKIHGLVERFLKTTEYRQRKKDIDEFNIMNRWRKKGIGFSLMHFHVDYFAPFPATVSIYHGDGTVIVSHGGIEMGQGMNTKAAQVAAHILGIPLEMITIEQSDTLNGANAAFTGASIGSECVCFAVRKACEILMNRLLPIRESMREPIWSSLVAKAHKRGVNLVASDYFKINDIKPYYVCGMALTELEIDILTGNHLINRVDILQDTGESLNPAVDVGQIEGGFVMGLGYYLTEQLVYDQTTGELLTNRSWNYKPPGCKDIPIDFRIELIQKSPNPAGFMSSKASGEPPICMSVSSLFAIQHALQSARKDAGLKREWIKLGAPTTPEHIVLNSGLDISQFRLQ